MGRLTERRGSVAMSPPGRVSSAHPRVGSQPGTTDGVLLSIRPCEARAKWISGSLRILGVRYISSSQGEGSVQRRVCLRLSGRRDGKHFHRINSHRKNSEKANRTPLRSIEKSDACQRAFQQNPTLALAMLPRFRSPIQSPTSPIANRQSPIANCYRPVSFPKCQSP